MMPEVVVSNINTDTENRCRWIECKTHEQKKPFRWSVKSGKISAVEILPLGKKKEAFKQVCDFLQSANVLYLIGETKIITEWSKDIGRRMREDCFPNDSKKRKYRYDIVRYTEMEIIVFWSRHFEDERIQTFPNESWDKIRKSGKQIDEHKLFMDKFG